MKVDAILVSRIFAPERAAAAYRLAALADAWVAQGGRIRVLTSTSPGGPRVAERGYRVSRWPVKRSRDGSVRGYLSYMSFDLPAALRLLLARRTDIVIAEPPPTTGAIVATVCAVRRIPFAYYAADCWSDAAAATSAPAPVVSFVRALETWAMRRAAVVLTVNEAIGERLRELEPRAHVAVVGNGVDTSIFTVDGPKTPVVGPTVVYTGTASEWQGAEILVDAWPAVLADHPHARLTFVGSGSSWPAIRARVGELGIAHAVTLIDTVPAATAAAHLRAATLSVVSIRPGLSYDYALPTKLFASLACGTPAVYVGEGAAAHFVSSIPRPLAAGSAVVPYEPGAIASAISGVLDAPATRDARRRLADWAIDRVSLSAVAERATAVLLRVGADKR